MTDTWDLDRAWRAFCEAIPDENWSDNMDKAAKRVEYEISDLGSDEEECDRDHCEDHEYREGGAWQYAQDILDKIRLGVYDENLHGSLKDVLEAIERRLGE